MKKIGIMGSGQLGMMSILENLMRGFEFYILCAKEKDPACNLANFYFIDNIEEFAQKVDIITYEFEHIDEKALKNETVLKKLKPGLLPLNLKQNRIKEKMFLKEMGFKTAPFYIADSLEKLVEILKSINKKAIIKDPKGGYDGKGQFIIDKDIKEEFILKNFKPKHTYLIEEFIDFDFELSCFIAKNKTGKAFLPITFNRHKNGILDYSFIYNNKALEEQAKRITQDLAQKLNIEEGVLTVEFFVKDNELYVNEFAPRVHNSFHHSLDTMSLSQFDLFIRAISNTNLYDPKILSFGGMVNLIGIRLTNKLLEKINSIKDAKIYWYKKEPRPNRKVGHINVLGDSQEEVLEKIFVIKSFLDQILV